MKYAYLIITLCILSLPLMSQQDTLSSIEKLESQKGVLILTEDFIMPRVKIGGGSLFSRIRRISYKSDVNYYYQLFREVDNLTVTASISHKELPNFEKALIDLIADAPKELTTSDYRENRYITNDGIHIGYSTKGVKLTWYIRVEKLGPDDYFFINKIDNLLTSIKDAGVKIKELQSK